MATVTKNSATKDQVLAYITANQSASGSLDHAIFVLDGTLPLVSDDQRTTLQLQKASLIAERAELEAEFEAFTSEGAAVSPPDPPTVAKVNQIADNIDAMVAASNAADALLLATTQMVNTLRAAGIPATGMAPAGMVTPSAANISVAKHTALFNALLSPPPPPATTVTKKSAKK